MAIASILALPSILFPEKVRTVYALLLGWYYRWMTGKEIPPASHFRKAAIYWIIGCFALYLLYAIYALMMVYGKT